MKKPLMPGMLLNKFNAKMSNMGMMNGKKKADKNMKNGTKMKGEMTMGKGKQPPVPMKKSKKAMKAKKK